MRPPRRVSEACRSIIFFNTLTNTFVSFVGRFFARGAGDGRVFSRGPRCPPPRAFECHGFVHVRCNIYPRVPRSHTASAIRPWPSSFFVVGWACIIREDPDTSRRKRRTKRRRPWIYWMVRNIYPVLARIRLLPRGRACIASLVWPRAIVALRAPTSSPPPHTMGAAAGGGGYTTMGMGGGRFIFYFLAL